MKDFIDKLKDFEDLWLWFEFRINDNKVRSVDNDKSVDNDSDKDI